MARRRPASRQEELDEPVDLGVDAVAEIEQLHKEGLVGRGLHSASFHCLSVSPDVESADSADEVGQPTIYRRSAGDVSQAHFDLTPGYREAIPTVTDEYPAARLSKEDGLDGMIEELLNEETEAGEHGFLPEAGFHITDRP